MNARILGIALLFSTAACGGLPDDTLIIETIEVTGVGGDQVFARNLEVEVHLYARTEMGREFLGCAGEVSGLDDVDLPDTTYRPFANFVDRYGDGPLVISELPETVFFIVTEDDSYRCPAEQSADGPDFSGNITERSDQDDLAGISDDVTSTSLRTRTQLDFDGATLVLRPQELPSLR